ncbi:MAG: RNA polymerase sigma factor [Planctomycetota bacterium]|jgi:RNA polymerase sigma-70 factor (ECF subfamily)
MNEMELTATTVLAEPARDDEPSLVERAKHDRHAFAALYRAHYPAVAGYVMRRIGDRHLADDLVADVFLSALRALPAYRHRGLPFRAWLLRIATNRVNRWARRERRRGPVPAGAPDGAVEDAPAADDAELARTALLGLPPRYQAVLSMHYLEGMPLRSIAIVLGCREGTVKSRLARGREALRRELERRMPR